MPKTSLAIKAVIAMIKKTIAAKILNPPEPILILLRTLPIMKMRVAVNKNVKIWNPPVIRLCRQMSCYIGLFFTAAITLSSEPVTVSENVIMSVPISESNVSNTETAIIKFSILSVFIFSLD